LSLEFARLLASSVGTRFRTLLGHVAMNGNEDQNEEEDSERMDQCEVVQPLGLAARPKINKKTECVVLREGDEVVILGMLDKSGPVHDIEEGETQVYSPAEPSCRIRLRANGDIEITAKAARDVVVNNGTKNVARVDDHIVLKQIAFTPGSGGAGLSINGVAIGIVAQDVDAGAISTGADHFKG